MTIQDVDIFVSGGGIAGLIAAAAFSRLGHSVVLADPSPPSDTAADTSSDLRSTAFLAPACDLLEAIGIWSDLVDYSSKLDALRVADCHGHPPSIRTERVFQASDIGETSFGWNLPNWLVRKRISDILTVSSRVDLRFGCGFRQLVTRDDHVIATLTDGSRIRARMAIAADGRTSPLRSAAGIEVRTTRYGQMAMAFAVNHPEPHGNISSELYLSGGAFTLVPLQIQDGEPASAVVWMEDGPKASALAKLDPDAFGRAATDRSCHVLGNLTIMGRRAIWPVVTQLATRLTSKRVALVAEAAHVLPPIGAQGLNTSLRDIAALIDLASDSPNEIGSREFLANYEKKRATDLRMKSRAIDLYNRVCKSSHPSLQGLRNIGLQLVHDVEPLRQKAMRVGLGD